MKFCTTTVLTVAVTAAAAMFCIISGAIIAEKPKPDQEIKARFGEVMQIAEHLPIIGTVFGSIDHVMNGLSGNHGHFPGNPLEGITGNSPSNPLGAMSGQPESNPFQGVTGSSPSMQEGILGESPSMQEGILGESPSIQKGILGMSPSMQEGILGESLSNKPHTGLPTGGGLTENSISGAPGGGGGLGGHGLISTLLDLVDSLLTSLGLNKNEDGLLTPILKLLNIEV